MNTERLRLQIDVLRQIPPKRFDMSTWSNPKEPCGTTFCAFGYLALDPRAQAEGLYLEARIFGEGDDTDDDPMEVRKLETIEKFNEVLRAGHSIESVTPTFNGFDDFDAAAEFFDLHLTKIRFLFHPDSYDIGVIPGTVIERIEALIGSEL